jgi:hypothetical protein
VTTHRVQEVAAWAYAAPYAYDDLPMRRAIEAGCLEKCRVQIRAAQMVEVEDAKTVHWQAQAMPKEGEPVPSMGIPYRPGDIIPEGWYVLWGVLVTVKAYDPQEQT